MHPLAPAHVADLLNGPGRITALVGGGGKTTLLHALGTHLGSRVVLTTTTQMAIHEVGNARLLVGPSPEEVAAAVVDENQPILVWDRIDNLSPNQPKAFGVKPSIPSDWLKFVDHVVVEADGSRGRPAKAPAPHEPELPTGPVDVVAVIGADALDRVIADQCHRPLRLAAVVGCSPYERLTPERAAVLLTHHNGARRGVPADGGFAIAVTKVNDIVRPLIEHLVDAIDERSPTTSIHLFDDRDRFH
ncbi:MAG: selenium cofactor biosynthesis protein YqeC [Acidimicrobiales bacterium]|nr:selenium cofactor biosynthesis protein YqeC [Acidimicrobiales bacterium]